MVKKKKDKNKMTNNILKDGQSNNNITTASIEIYSKTNNKLHVLTGLDSNCIDETSTARQHDNSRL